MQKTYTMTMLVKNKPGCLDRIAGITRRYGWNIVSAVCAETPDTAVTRITMALECDKFCEWPDGAIRKLDFVLDMDVCDDVRYTFHEVLVARGPEESFSGHLENAVRKTTENGSLTVWWLGEDAYIADLERKLSELPGVSTVRSGPMALRR